MTQKPSLSLSQKTEKTFAEEIRSATFAKRAQIVIAWDGAALTVESPGRNGVREKIEGITLASLPQSIQIALLDQLDRIKAETRLAPKVERIDPEVERRERNAAIARENADRDRAWLDSLSPRDREREESKREERRQRIIDAENARAREIWNRTAKSHSIDLANLAISDPARRPNRRVVVSANVGGPKVTYNPRFDSAVGSKKQKSTKPVEKLILDLDL